MGKEWESQRFNIMITFKWRLLLYYHWKTFVCCKLLAILSDCQSNINKHILNGREKRERITLEAIGKQARLTLMSSQETIFVAYRLMWTSVCVCVGVCVCVCVGVLVRLFHNIYMKTASKMHYRQATIAETFFFSLPVCSASLSSSTNYWEIVYGQTSKHYRSLYCSIP